MRQRFVQFPRSAMELFLQAGGGRMTAARGYLRTVPLRFIDFAAPCFYRFTTCGAMPLHLALQFGRRTIPYHSIELCCASQQSHVADVRFGSKADMAALICDVRFAPNSGHCQHSYECML